MVYLRLEMRVIAKLICLIIGNILILLIPHRRTMGENPCWNSTIFCLCLFDLGCGLFVLLPQARSSGFFTRYLWNAYAMNLHKVAKRYQCYLKNCFIPIWTQSPCLSTYLVIFTTILLYRSYRFRNLASSSNSFRKVCLLFGLCG